MSKQTGMLSDSHLYRRLEQCSPPTTPKNNEAELSKFDSMSYERSYQLYLERLKEDLCNEAKRIERTLPDLTISEIIPYLPTENNFLTQFRRALDRTLNDRKLKRTEDVYRQYSTLFQNLSSMPHLNEDPDKRVKIQQINDTMTELYNEIRSKIEDSAS